MSRSFSFRRLLVAILAVALLAGIRLSEPWFNRPGETRDDASPSDQDPHTPTDLARAIEVAREYINQQSRTPMDATYTAKRTADGYRVFVGFKSYDEDGQPLHIARGHCLLEISKDWRVGGVAR
jgi:hypothetical protein